MNKFYDLPSKIIESVDKAMDSLDWDRVKRTMDFLDWEWVGTNEGVPEIYEMKKSVRNLCLHAYEDCQKTGKQITAGTGGFEVICFYDDILESFEFEIRFILAHSWGY